MSLVRVEYFRDGKRATELCTLITREDSVQIPGKILLEDNFGLWYLDKSDLISMEPMTKSEQNRHAWQA